jgi:uncharacterized repeat protein (TIGR04138 family)
MTMHLTGLAEVMRRDPRYAYEAYVFVFEALQHTQQRLGRGPQPDAPAGPAEGPESPHHVSGPELLAGICDLAQREFGLMAPAVFRLWGIRRTDDFGEIVFNLVECKLMSKTEEDSRADFHALFDLDEALVRGYRIPALEL